MASRSAAASKKGKEAAAKKAPSAKSRRERAVACCRAALAWDNAKYYVAAAFVYAVLFAVYLLVSRALPETGPLASIGSENPRLE